MHLLSYDSGGRLHVTRDLADDELKPYAILSHTWMKDEDEVKYSEVGSPLGQKKPGYTKIEFCGKQAQRDGLQHFWVDTCCINKSSSAELSEAINSMYHWYQKAQVCYVYLADVSFSPTLTGQDWRFSFRQSRWFTRGWTLQELLAPRNVVFYSKEWGYLGTKENLKELLHNITSISIKALEGHSLSSFPVIERMHWTRGRQTKKKEDKAYCLFGIFGVSMDMRYGEGDNAFRRLQKELEAQSYDGRAQAVHDYSFQNPAGSCLGQAPTIEDKYFAGRNIELEQMANMLHLNNNVGNQRCVVVLGGVGGIGKTQLALAYAQKYSQHYDSVFWLNATSEATLLASFQTIGTHIFAPRSYDAMITQHWSTYVLSWLSHPRNTRWLLIFDNYDEPLKYGIQLFYPIAAHGKIIVTTRRPRLVAGGQIPVNALATLDESLQILRTRSRRDNIEDDLGAKRLALRLQGFPLALATAGVSLQKSTWTFQQYLDVYETQLTVSARDPLILPEYKHRTLYTTWNISYDQLLEEEPAAARLLDLLAYFDHQAIWYDLLHAGIRDNLPGWLLEIVGNPINFESIMQILVEYCFVDLQETTHTYSMHTCVHDWILSRALEPWSYWYAFHCLAISIGDEDWYSFGHLKYAKFTPHAISLMSDRFADVRHDLADADVGAAYNIATLLQSQDQLSVAGRFVANIHAVIEKRFGAEHISTLSAVQKLGGIYYEQGQLAEAEQMYVRALAGYEKVLGAEHQFTLNTVHNLGRLYYRQGKLVEAEQMYVRALAGYEKVLGAEHQFTLNTVYNLGCLYYDQGKLAEAEQMYVRALAGYEKILGAEHHLTLNTVKDLGILYYDQSKLAEAEQMYVRALAGQEKVLGAEHTATLSTLHYLGHLYYKQSRLAEAEQIYVRALAGGEKVRGMEYTVTLYTVNNLGLLYYDQGKLAEAEQMYVRALAGQEKVLGAEHTATLSTLYNLGILYLEQGKLAEAEQMLLRALTGGKLAEAEQILLRALTGGKLAESKQMLLRALTGREKVLRPASTDWKEGSTRDGA